MFAMSGRAAVTESYVVTDRVFFLPPTLSHGLESPPLEELRLLRDEMANMAWAVEAIVQDELGLPISGYDLAAAGDRRARERARLIAQEAVRVWRPFAAAVETARDAAIRARGTAGGPAADAALLAAEQAEQASHNVRDQAIAAYVRAGGDMRDLFDLPSEETEGTIVPTYKLLTEVPRNWIPLLPKPVGGGQIMLRRGAMPDLQGAADGAVPQRIRPRGVLLRPDMRPFLLHEEEIPRVGVHVVRTAQYTRWLNGTSHFWIGRSKESGRGEGWSGLRFDRVEDEIKT